MKSSTEIRVTLELTAAEAAWLHEVMQNPLTEGGDPNLEDPYDRMMREAFYEATEIEGRDED
ncbi:hypothetical protein ZC03_052 [Pseudomonas phage ZC03]|uniref:Uncharacterized protein n=1 Tax=Pseudomonas phage ZC03 TaxID=1622115 RepID=A0A1L2C948_9CAUD|nr:hypothetical protein HWA93_gp77 [Pseudomonas phage ZC03]AMD43429.1 hypothetical protein ZC03_052 [Pseudomonas phage ZC03]